MHFICQIQKHSEFNYSMQRFPACYENSDSSHAEFLNRSKSRNPAELAARRSTRQAIRPRQSETEEGYARANRIISSVAGEMAPRTEEQRTDVLSKSA